MNTKAAKTAPFRAAVPAAALTSGLMAPLALAGPGDLDPGFGDVGRLGPILNGPAWSLEALDDGRTLLAGGDWYYFYYWGYYEQTTNFVRMLAAGGSIDPAFMPTSLANVQVFDAGRQADGDFVAVGRTVSSGAPNSRLTAYRLQADGRLLDPTFASNGILRLAAGTHGARHVATSLLLEADGRIVIAGSADDRALVLRLLPDGSPDLSFGVSGAYVGPETHAFPTFSIDARTHIVRAAGGGYRITASGPAGCRVIALTANGTVDPGFGASGTAVVPVAGASSCSSMTAQDDGSLLVAGHADGRGFAVRLLANGQPDPGFAGEAVADALSEATAIAAGEGGAVLVAGRGSSGAAVMRLEADGGPDLVFGRSGTTLLDLKSEIGTSPWVRDMHVADDGSVTAVGGDDPSRRAFVVKLLGAAGGASPGVLGFYPQNSFSAREGGDDIVLEVRRTGGADGSVNLTYQTDEALWSSATAGQDYTPVSGQLTWEDGDTASRQISVPILVDASVEGLESFRLTLGAAQGGAGLGTHTATITIEPDGAPYGQFSILTSASPYKELGPARVSVTRDYYGSGVVSVTVTPMSGTATAGADFDATPVTLTWADGELGSKEVAIPLVNDGVKEPRESFTVHLSNATGGALVGQQSIATVFVTDSIATPSKTVRGGGGAFGWVSALLLGLAGVLGRARVLVRRDRRGP